MSHVSGVPIDEFEVLYLDCFVDLVEPRTTLYSYHRDSTDIEEWLVNTVLRVERIKRAVEMDYFPRNDNGCLTYNRPCEFMVQIGRAHVLTPDTNAHIVCRLLLETTNYIYGQIGRAIV